MTPDFVEDLFRVGVLLTRKRSVALECVARALAEAEARASQWRTQKHRFLWAVRFMSELPEVAVASAGRVTGFSESVASVVETIGSGRPELRGALSLHALGRSNAVELTQLFRLRVKDWRAALASFDSNLVSQGLDWEQVRGRLQDLTLEPQERARLELSVGAVPVRSSGSDKALAIAAVLMGAGLLLAWMWWEQWRESVPVRMRSHMDGLLQPSLKIGKPGFEIFAARVSDTPDWLFLHGMEGLKVPKRFEKIALDGGRLLDWAGGSFALFTTTTLPGFVIVISAEQVGLVGENAVPGQTSFGEWSGAWEVAGPYAVIWMSKTSVAAMEEALGKL